MKTSKLMTRIFGIISLVMLVSCVVLYCFLKVNMDKRIHEMPAPLITASNFIIPAFAVVGIFHIILLLEVFRSISGKFKDSVFVVLIIISGIALLSDFTLLSDIGKEYLHFDVSQQWLLLFLFTAYHIIVVIWGLARERRSEQLPTGAKSDRILISMHHIGLLSGILGICGLIIAHMHIIDVKERLIPQLAALIAVLALLPLIMFIIFWINRSRKIKLKQWMDEKQDGDMKAGALISTIAVIPLYAVACVFDLCNVVMPVSSVVLGLFFVQLIVFSSVFIRKNSKI